MSRLVWIEALNCPQSNKSQFTQAYGIVFLGISVKYFRVDLKSIDYDKILNLF